MKFTLATISAALLAVSSVSGAVINKRQDANQDPNQAQPQPLDIGALNGTWYLTGVTQSVWDVYEIIQKTMNINLNCPHFDVSQASETSFDALVSAFLTHSTSNTVGVTASGAGAFMLQDSDATVNTTANENLWTAYGSQAFVNEANWKNFTSQGQSTEDPANAGSVAIPGTQPFEATVYSKLIDSNAEPGSETLDNLDTVFLWGTEATFLNTRKRADEVYGLILSKQPNVGEDVFNKTLALLPPAIAQNNITVVLLQDSCEGADNNDQQNNDQSQ